MKILAVDSSATAASTAIMQNDKIIGEFYINTQLTHSQTLMPMIDELLKNTKIKLDDIDALAVNTGPGSFTGIRIGVCAIKGMAMAKNKPCIAVSTLESMAYNLINFNGIVCCVMDARCNQVYNAVFEVKNNNIKRICNDRALSILDLKKELQNFDEEIYLVGDGASLCFEALADLKNIRLTSQNLRYQRASSVCAVALEKYGRGEICTASQLIPQYLRLPQAQRELKKRLEDKKQ